MLLPKNNRDLTDADIIRKEHNLSRWLSNNLRQKRWQQAHFETNRLKAQVLPLFEKLEKQVSLQHLLDNLFLVVEDADFDLKDIETIRHLGSLTSNHQEKPK
jgi:hypothetical protein